MPFVSELHYLYTVQPGDTLYGMARRFQSDVELIRTANAIYPPFTDPDLIFPGQELLIPTFLYGFTHVNYVVQAGDTLWNIAQRFGTHPDIIAGLSPHVYDPATIFVNQILQIPAFVYAIQPGDTLGGVAAQTGVPLESIIRANERRPYFSPDLIYPGYRIIVPAGASRNIFVTRPLPGQEVRQGFELSGIARAFEANVNFQVRDANGVIVTDERFTTAEMAGPAYAPFRTTVPFDRRPTANTGELWVYTRSAADGSIQDLVRIRIRFV
jgi:LysM repeat protein